MGSIIQINKKFYEIEEVFADKQVVDKLIIDFQLVSKTQNNLIDKLKKWEKQITDNFISLKEGMKNFETDNIANLVELDTKIKKLKENKDRADFASECFMKQIKIEKNTKINNANIHLLEMRMDNVLENKINNILERKIYNIELRLDNIDKYIQNNLIKIKLIEKHCKN